MEMTNQIWDLSVNFAWLRRTVLSIKKSNLIKKNSPVEDFA